MKYRSIKLTGTSIDVFNLDPDCEEEYFSISQHALSDDGAIERESLIVHKEDLGILIEGLQKINEEWKANQNRCLYCHATEDLMYDRHRDVYVCSDCHDCEIIAGIMSGDIVERN